MSDDSAIQQAIAEKLGSVKTTLCLSDKVVIITEDRLELLLADGIEKLSHRNAWLAPAGILASCIAALTTANFHDFAQLKAPVWQSIFLLVAIASTVWLIQTLFKRRKPFGRTEFLNSIRVAGTRLNYGEPAVAISSEQPSTDLTAGGMGGNTAKEDARSSLRVEVPAVRSSSLLQGRVRKEEGKRAFATQLQCRQCGNLITKPRSRVVIACSRCGALN